MDFGSGGKKNWGGENDVVNLLWAGMIIASIIIAAVNGKMEIITPLIFASAEQAVNIALGLISVMVFWLE